jgi:tetratricopeptide (TPR) repeat protein
MNADRLSMLQRFVEQRPGDPFAHYGLAMELKKLGRIDEADRAFLKLVADHPDYVATYLMYGNLLMEKGDAAGAMEIYSLGIDAARKNGNDHALSELEAAKAAAM